MSFDMTEPFRRYDAVRAGVSPAELRRALRAGDLISLRKGTYVDREALVREGLDHLRGGLQREVRGAAVCLESAAQFHGFALLGRPPGRLTLVRDAAPRRKPWDSAGLCVLAAGLPSSHLCLVGRVVVTSPARTVVDIARNRPFRSAVVTADDALRRGVSRDAMERVLAECTGWPGVRRARLVVAFADGDAETPLESVGRVMMWEEGLPKPKLQQRFYDGSVLVARTDFWFAEHRTVGEADGRIKYVDDDPDVVADRVVAEKEREEQLHDLGVVEVVRFGWRGALRQGPATAARFRRAFARAARYSA